MKMCCRFFTIFFMPILWGLVVFSPPPLEASDGIPMDPLAASGDYTVLGKSRATISFVDGVKHPYTFVAQRAVVSPDLSPLSFGGYHAWTDRADLDTDGTDIKRVFAMTSTGGFVPEDYTYEFYGETYTARDVPRSVVCNVYLTRHDGNHNNKLDKSDEDSYLYIELTGYKPRDIKPFRVSKPLRISNLPNPAVTVNYQGDAQFTHNETENTVLLDMIANDWNGDGYSDYVVAYVHKVGNQDSHPSGDDNNRVVLVHFDGKSLYEYMSGQSSVFPAYHYDDSRVFGTGANFTGLLAGATPALSLRLAVGDADGDGEKEVGVYHTRPSGEFDDNHFYLLGVRDGRFQQLAEKKLGRSYCENDVVGIAMGDLDGDGRDEIVLLHGSTPAVRKASQTWINIYRYENGSLTHLVDNKQYDGDDAKTYDVLEERNEYNDKATPYHAFSVGSYEVDAEDLDGDGRAELVFSRVTHLHGKDGLKVTVHTWPDGVRDLGEYRHFYLTSDNPSGTPGLTEYFIDPNYACYSMAVDTFQFPIEGAHAAGGEYGMAKQIAVVWQHHTVMNWGIFAWNRQEGMTRLGAGQDLNKNFLFWSDDPRNSHDYRTMQIRPQIVAADFGLDTLVLGAPFSFEVEKNIEVATILGAPPKHIDIISGDVNGKMDASGSSYAESLFSEKGYNTQFTNAGTVKAVEQTLESFANNLGIGGGVTLSRNFLLKPNVPLFEAALGITASWARNNLTTDGVSATISGKTTAHDDDQVFFTARNYTVWRYPILFPEELRSQPVIDQDGEVQDEQQYMQFVVPENSGASTDILSPARGRNIGWYEPPYDTNNLFTYPSAYDAIWGYSASKNTSHYPQGDWSDLKGILLGTIRDFDVANTDPNSVEFSWNIDHTDENATKWGVTAGTNLSGNIPLPIPIPMTRSTLSLSLKEDFSWQTTTTASSSTFESGGIKLSMSNTEPNQHSGQPIDETGFTMDAALFTTDSGTLMAGYAVTKLQDIKHILWGSVDSPYNKYNDPGLLLPFRFDSGGHPAKSVNAHLIRGMTFGRGQSAGNVDFSGMPAKMLLMGEETKMTFRVVNYSFVDSRAFTASIHWQPIPQGGDNISNPPDISKATLVDNAVPIPGIPGREQVRGEDNWADVECQWQAPSQRGLGYLFVRLDYDEGLLGPQLNVDNDWGYVLVGVGSREDLEALQEIRVASAREQGRSTEGAPNLSITDVSAMSESGVARPLDALPSDERADLSFKIHLDMGNSGVAFLPGIHARLLAGRSLIAAQELPLLRDGDTWTMTLQIDPSTVDASVEQLILEINSSYLRIRDESDVTDNIVRLRFGDYTPDPDPTGGSGGSGCDAGLTNLLLLSVLAGFFIRKRRG